MSATPSTNIFYICDLKTGLYNRNHTYPAPKCANPPAKKKKKSEAQHWLIKKCNRFEIFH